MGGWVGGPFFSYLEESIHASSIQELDQPTYPPSSSSSSEGVGIHEEVGDSLQAAHCGLIVGETWRRWVGGWVGGWVGSFFFFLLLLLLLLLLLSLFFSPTYLPTCVVEEIEEFLRTHRN